MVRFLTLIIALALAAGSCGRPIVELDPSVKLRELKITCGESRVPRNIYFPCEASGTYSDGSEKKVTDEALWTIEDPSVLESAISDNPSKIRGIAPGETQVTAQIGTILDSASIVITDATPVSIALAPQNKVFQLGSEQQFTSICIFSDNSYHDVTTSAAWSASDSTIAKITGSALVQTKSSGSALITASFDSIQGSAGITVLDKSLLAIQVTPRSTEVIKGLSKIFQVTGFYTDLSTVDLGTQATWSVSNSQAASISNASGSRGKLTALGTGSSTVTAMYGSFSDTAIVTITDPTLQSIDLSPQNLSLPKGLSQQFTAMGHYSDGSTVNITQFVSWGSSNNVILSVGSAPDPAGTLHGISVGSSNILATLDGVTGSTSASVTDATLNSISLSPSTVTLAKGLTQQLTATANYSDGVTINISNASTWSTSDPTVMSVSNLSGQQGLLNANGIGSAFIYAILTGVTGSLNTTVTSATLTSIALTPNNPTLALGNSQQFTATGYYSDASSTDLTSSVTWSSNDTAKATVSNSSGTKGALSTVATGSVTVAAILGGVTGQTSVTVSSPALSSIALTPANPSLALGVSQSLTATGTYTDGSTADITSSVTWSSNDTAKATISNSSGTKGALSTIATGSATISAVLSGVTGQTTVTVTAATLSSIALTPGSPSIPLGSSQSLTATGTYTDGSTANLTTSATWSSDDASKATVSNSGGTKGALSTVATGSATISAVLGGVTGQTTVTVTAAALSAIALTPSSPSVPLGSSQSLTATGTYTDGSTADLTSSATWSSDDASKATVSNSGGTKGALSTIATGSATISAVLGGVTGQTTVTVTAAALSSIALTPSSPSVPLGSSQSLTATGTYTDGSTADLTSSATWSSSDTSKATVSNSSGTKGALSTVATGSVTVAAILGGVTGQTSVTVSSPALSSIALTPANPSLALGVSQSLTATGTYTDGSTADITSSVTWSSNDTAKATISNSSGTKGALSTIATGSATISAVLSGVTGQTTVTVTAATLSSIALTPGSPSIPLGSSQSLTATGTYTDGSTANLTTSATWSSDDASKATVSNSGGTKGALSTVATGSATISAVLGGVTGQTTVTVTAAALSAIALTPSSPSVPLGSSQSLTATGTYTDGSTADLTSSATWSSDDASKATVSNSGGTKGALSTIATGSATISAVLGGVTGQTTVTVTAAALSSIALTPSSPSVPLGSSQSLTATGTYTDGSTADLTSSATWSSSDTSKATVSNSSGTQGALSTVATGSTTISAVLSGVTGQTTVTVAAAALSSIVLTPSSPSLALGTSQSLTATGTYTDGSTADITSSATWSSSDTSKATVSNSSGTQGAVSSVALGSATISAVLSGVTGQTTVTVSAPELASIAVTPATQSLAKGLTLQFTATGTYTDSSTADITSNVTWSTGSPSVASISNSSGTRGLATGVTVGSSTVIATLGSVNGQTTLTITAPTLVSIAVTPANSTIVLGQIKQFTATGTYTDASTADITTGVTWASSNSSTATISNASGTEGRASGLGLGSTTISATATGGVVGSTQLNGAL